MQYRGKDEKHVAWVAALKALFVALRGYLKAHHASAASWNKAGCELADYSGSAPPAAAPRPPPPPPPPPPPGSLTAPRAGAAPAGEKGMAAVFGQLNKGEAVSSGLRKVTDDMKTKNRAERSGAVPGGSAREAAPAKAAGGGKPARTACEGGRKWVVEHYVGGEVTLGEVSAKQTVYVFGCSGTTVTVSSKCNSLCVDGCSKTAVVFADVVAAVEVVNCSAVELQATGVVPTVAVDNCAGVQLYLGAQALGCAVTTAKSSAVNVLTPGATPEADLVEAAIPEQFVTTYANGRWTTEAVAHSAG